MILSKICGCVTLNESVIKPNISVLRSSIRYKLKLEIHLILVISAAKNSALRYLGSTDHAQCFATAENEIKMHVLDASYAYIGTVLCHNKLDIKKCSQTKLTCGDSRRSSSECGCVRPSLA